MFRRIITRIGYAILGVFLVVPALARAASQNGPTKAPTCRPAGALTGVPELREGSGVAASKRSPGRFWAHNDSGEPALIALDSTGKVLGQVRVPGAKVDDWEAVAVGPCPGGSCIYVGDIGDNNAKRRDITIYRVPEPADVTGPVGNAEVFRARYPDGAHDAETLLVTPQGDILIVTKGDTGPVGLYRLPPEAKPGGTVTLQSIGRPRESGKPEAEARITDGDVSPNGAWVALRSKTAIFFHRTADLMAGNWTPAGRVSLKALGEPQGEGLAFGDDTTLYLVGEGGGKSRPGTFGRVTCAF